MNKQELISKIKSLQDISSEEKAYLIELVNTKKKYGLVWEEKPEVDLLTLYFSATDMLPRNSMRNLVANANNALKNLELALTNKGTLYFYEK